MPNSLLSKLSLAFILFLPLEAWGQAESRRACVAGSTNVIAYGDYVECQHPGGLTPQSWQLRAEAGDIIGLIAVRLQGANTSPYVEIQSPSGVAAVLPRTAGSGGVYGRPSIGTKQGLRIPATGTYTILITAPTNNIGAFQYSLIVERLFQPSPSATLLKRDVRTGTASISPFGDRDLYSFYAASGDQVTIRMERTGGTGTPRMWITDHAGGADYGSASIFASYVYRVPETGYYTVWATEGDDDSAIDYTMLMTCTGTCPDPFSVSPASLSFEGVQGSTPPEQTLDVSSTPSAQAFQAEVVSGSIRLSAANGVTPAQVRVAVGPLTQPSGSYSWSVRLTGPNKAVINVPITVNIRPPAASTITASPSSLRFEAVQGTSAPEPQNIALSTSGSAENFTVQSDQAWLTATPANGALPARLQVSVRQAGLSPGSYSGKLTVRGSVSPEQVVQVSLLVTEAAGPRIDSVSAGAAGAGIRVSSQEQILQIQGANFAASHTITVRGPDGRALDGIRSTEVTPNSVRFIAVLSRAGTHVIQIINSETRSASNEFVFTVAAPGLLRAEPASFKVSALENSVQVEQRTLQLTGGQSFQVGAINDSWVSVSPTTGQLPSLLQILLNPRGLAVGRYSATIPVTNDAGDTVGITVQLEIQAGETDAFQVAAPDLNFALSSDPTQAKPKSLIVTVRSASRSDLVIKAKAKNDSQWLSIAPSQVTVSPGQAAEMTVRLLPTALTSNNLSDALLLSTGATTRELPVSVTFFEAGQATALVSTTGLTLFAALVNRGTAIQNINDQRDFILYNLGPGPLNWFINPDRPFFNVQPLTGDGLAAQQYERVSIGTLGLIENLKPEEGISKSSSVLQLRLNGQEKAKSMNIVVRLAEKVPPRIDKAGAVFGPGDLSSQEFYIRPGYSGEGAQVDRVSDQPVIINTPAWLEVVGGSQRSLSSRDGLSFTLRATNLANAKADTVTVEFPGIKLKGDSTSYTINIGVLPTGLTAADNKPGARRLAGESCTPTRLYAVFVNPGDLFSWEAGLPLDLQAKILTDCGEPLVAGAATLSFSTGEPPIAMDYWPDGIWRATWIPRISGPEPVRLRLAAVADDGGAFTQVILQGIVADPGQ